MAVFDRDPALERRQILEISANVARRLLDVLDRSRYASTPLRMEIEETVTVITGIQRDVDQIVTGMPGHEALDVAILTHILGGQQHALERLEDLEAKLKGDPHHPPPPDPTSVHAALIATAREIEREALRYGAAQPAAGRHQAFATLAPLAPTPLRPVGLHHPAPAPAGAPPPPQRPPPAAPPRPEKKLSQTAAWADLAGIDLAALLATPARRTALGIAAVGCLAVSGWLMVPAPTPPPHDGPAAQERAREPADEAAAFARSETPSAPLSQSLVGASVSGPSLEQPYLVVLATRRSTEELQQDYRAFKQTYAELLAGSKARVDRIQGQDRQTYYRLSLIPPQSHAEAKTLCSRLRSAGLAGCWIRQVPVN